MKSGFDANVPKRKPRTRLGVMLSELDENASSSPPATPLLEESSAPELGAPLGASDHVESALADAFSDGLVVVAPPVAAVPPPPASAPPPMADARPHRPAAPEIQAGGTTVKTGKARIAELRARLDAANKRREEKPPEPEATASRVRETVAALSQRLEQTRADTAALTKALESAKRELGETQEQLELERKARIGAETLAAERQTVADELLVESEALAQERDRALSCIAELKELDAQQAALLSQLESTLAERDKALDKAQAQVVELRAAAEAATADADAMQARLHLVLSERSDLEARVGRLEAELSRAISARQALGEIQKLVDSIG
jgi:chromosome segregation ATPase